MSIGIKRSGPIGPLLAPRDRTLADYAPVFLKWLGFVRQRRENTVRSYGEDLKMFLRFCEEAGLSKPDDVDFRHIEFYLGWLQMERGLKPSSANRHLHALRTFWKYLVREGITTTNPAADVFVLPTRKTLPRYLTIPEQERLLAALATDRTPLGRRDYALVATGLLTGLRCSELSNLQLGHLDLAAGVVRVVDGKGRKDRELPVVPRLEAILRDYLEAGRRPLVGRPRGSFYLARGGRPTGLKYYVDGVKHYQNLSGQSADEAAKTRAALAPMPTASPYVFVNASPRQSHRVKRAGQPLGPKAIFYTVRRLVADILARPGAHPHMLRHSFASRLRENGADLQDIQEALGHSVITTTTMYAHLTTRRQREKLTEYLK